MVPSLFRLTTKTTKEPHYCIFAMIVHQRPMDSHYKLFKYHGGIIIDTYIWATRGVLHWPRDCLFSRLFRLTATKRQRLLITVRCPSNTNELPLHRASDIESVSMLWRQPEGWQHFFIISLVVVRWLIYVTKLGGLSFRQWLGSSLVMKPANIPWSI